MENTILYSMKIVYVKKIDGELYWHMVGELIGWAITGSVTLITLYFVG